MTLLRIDAESNEWDDMVQSMIGHNVYQSAVYHRLAAQMDGGNACLFIFQEQTRKVAIPLLLREVCDDVPDDDAVTRDATSAYGYPGILSSTDDLPQDFIRRFQAAFRSEMQRENIVTVFVRLDVFRTGIELIEELGDVQKIGETVVIDLSKSNDERFHDYRRNHRSNISQLRALGASTFADSSLESVTRFEEAYRHSMQRVGAHPWFLFGLPYFRELCAQLPDNIEFLQTDIAGEMACGGMFFRTGDTAYAHLTATTKPWAGRSPTKVLFEDAATYFRNRGCRWLHIGGGLGAKNDSLYRFKRGFSDVTLPFYVWKYIVDQDRYDQLCQNTKKHSGGKDSESFFPLYRAGSTQ